MWWSTGFILKRVCTIEGIGVRTGLGWALSDNLQRFSSESNRHDDIPQAPPRGLTVETNLERARWDTNRHTHTHTQVNHPLLQS